MATTITSPIKKFTGRTHFGPFALDFKDGTAQVPEGESLPAGARAYLERTGYTVAEEDEGPFDPSKHNQDQVIEHLEREDVDDEERARVLAAEAERENGPRQKVAKWVETREAVAREAAEREAAKKAAREQGGGDAA
ncbi:hypothetical protein [Ornithinimicrobium cerasi]|uniref:hypothetical protein n=1 Tax=Ornithinimicrobium cerasi TaxID=2248773 RepID=UPI000F008E7B|nr:hypothetical protein [Ornithinimicrobium cerasi]